jgi:hypothetical protein
MTIDNMVKLSDMTGTLEIPESVCERMSRYWTNFPALDDKQYSELVYQTEISSAEFIIIQAMRTAMAIDMVESKIKMQDYLNLKDDHKWVESYRKNNFKGYEEAENHLKLVDDFYMRKYKYHYDLWYIDQKNEIPILEWDSECADRIVKKYDVKFGRKKSSIFEE